MSDRLVVTDVHNLYYIQWELEEEGDMGARLGEGANDGKGPAPKERGNWEHWVANKLLRDLKVPRTQEPSGFYFESVGEATKALRLIRGTFAAGREMPEWARQATEAGWKPPRGWKP